MLAIHDDDAGERIRTSVLVVSSTYKQVIWSAPSRRSGVTAVASNCWPIWRPRVSLADLLNQATPGWAKVATRGGSGITGVYVKDDCVPLIAQAPDMARLLIDMAAYLDKTIYDPPGWSGPRPWWACEADALLARFAALDTKAGGTG